MTYIFEAEKTPVTVVEMATFSRDAGRHWSEEEQTDFTDYIARHPEAGALVSGTGGFRKVRWAVQGQGKRGGVRVIYFFHREDRPLYLTAIYGKGEKDNLTPAERNELRSIAAEMKRL